MCIFPPLSNTVYEWVKWRMSSEWMWRKSERSGCGEYLLRIFICVWQKKYFYVFLFCTDIM